MDTAELEKKYRDEYRPKFVSLAARISTLLEDLLKDKGIPVVQIEHRAKTVESFLGKVRLKNYEVPFDEIKDFAGVRVVTYYNDDVEHVAFQNIEHRTH